MPRGRCRRQNVAASIKVACWCSLSRAAGWSASQSAPGQSNIGLVGVLAGQGDPIHQKGTSRPRVRGHDVAQLNDYDCLRVSRLTAATRSREIPCCIHWLRNVVAMQAFGNIAALSTILRNSDHEIRQECDLDVWATVVTLVSYRQASLSVASESTTFDLIRIHVLAGWSRKSFVYSRQKLALYLIHKAQDT